MNDFRLNSAGKNDVILPLKCGNFTRPEFYGIYVCLVLASATAKTSVCTEFHLKSIHYYYFRPPYLF